MTGRSRGRKNVSHRWLKLMHKYRLIVLSDIFLWICKHLPVLNSGSQGANWATPTAQAVSGDWHYPPPPATPPRNWKTEFFSLPVWRGPQDWELSFQVNIQATMCLGLKPCPLCSCVSVLSTTGVWVEWTISVIFLIHRITYGLCDVWLRNALK